MTTIGIIGAGEVGARWPSRATTPTPSSSSPAYPTQFDFDTADNSPLSDSWRSASGTPMWHHHVHGQSRAELVRNLLSAAR